MDIVQIIEMVGDVGALGVLLWALYRERERVDRLIEYNLRMTETCFGEHLQRMQERGDEE